MANDGHDARWERGAAMMKAIGNPAPGPGRNRFPALPPEQADDVAALCDCLTAGVRRRFTRPCDSDTGSVWDATPFVPRCTAHLGAPCTQELRPGPRHGRDGMAYRGWQCSV